MSQLNSKSSDIRKVSQDKISPKMSGSGSSDQGSFDASMRKLSNGTHGRATCEGSIKQKEKGLLGIELWNKYYFCIISHGLYKHQGPTSNSVKESWALKESKVVDFDNMSGKQHTFCLFLKEGTKIVLQAENPFDKQRWM